VHDQITQSFPAVDIAISMVWIEMLPNDNAEAVEKSAVLFQDERIRHFHDPNHFVGQVIAESVGTAGHIAWDMYLFYTREGSWGEKPPAPFGWAHQLNETWVVPGHYAWGDALPVMLHQIMTVMIKG
jgi:hypothetical protein